MAALKRVRALTAFYDLGAGVNRAEGEEFEAPAKRIAEMNACGPEQGGVPLVEEVAAPEEEKTAREG